ncbi:DegT/DnrJ/EryC1/StrS family aminotransferase [Prochlorococcus sp. AH-736-B04]|nr:DegT/DnrJ/EryC1/StrS family aminotransferase [Prochlorococcus sp. AH-736-B04]
MNIENKKKYFTTMNLPAPSYAQFQNTFNQFIISKDKFNKDLENELRMWLSAKEIFCFSNCFTAISLAIKSSVKNNSPFVAVAALGYRRTMDIINWAGLKPFILDNDINSLALSLEELEESILNNHIGCILLQHPMVNNVEINKYLNISEKYCVPLIVDSVEVTGSGSITRKYKKSSAYCEAISVHPSKVLNGVEGGILGFDNYENIENFKKFLIDNGIYSKKMNKQILLNQEPIHKIMTLSSLRNYKKSNLVFKELYFEYLNQFSNSNHLKMITHADNNSTPNYKTVLVKLDNKIIKYTNNIICDLNNINIGARSYYSPIHKYVIRAKRKFKNAEKISKSYIILPMNFHMNKSDVRHICNQLNKLIRNYIK